MSDEEDFTIQQPYKPTENEKKAIAELTDKGLSAEDWDSKRKGIREFKDHLRDDIWDKQNERCAYCRIYLPSGSVHLHREHIVDKKDHPEWMFLPENLCVSCPICNEYKGTTEVLSDPLVSKYPKNGEGFKIIHPMYDRYSDNIEIVGGILYRAKTTKGRFTIDTCHLYREKLAEARARKIIIVQKNGSIISQILGLLEKSDSYVDDLSKLIENVNKLIDKYKQKQK